MSIRRSGERGRGKGKGKKPHCLSPLPLPLYPFLRRRGRRLGGEFRARVLLVEDDGELRAEHEDEAGDVAPREHGDDRADRAVNLVVVKILEARSEDVLAGLPGQTGDDGTRSEERR